ncbi:MAG: M28 family peptidase [Myxococcales bacterium]|nr:M28 family peptidase [Myxococcales bacterium]
MKNPTPGAAFVVDATSAIGLIRRIIALGSRRIAGSETEQRAQQMVADSLVAAGVASIDYLQFSFTGSIHAVITLHFGVAVFGTLLLPYYPVVSALLHGFAAFTWWGESTKRFQTLRYLLPRIHSQTLIATSPARGVFRRRLVFVGHADAAYTGLLFHPTVIRLATTPPPIPGFRFMRKSMLVATVATALLVPVDMTFLLLNPAHPWLWMVAVILTIPALLSVLLNLEVLIRNRPVPGANDNLSGSVANIVLAHRLIRDQPDDVELQFVVTGCEEAGTGGAWALAEARKLWNTQDTVVIGIDGLSNGTLCYFEEGEIFSFPIPPSICAAIEHEAGQLPPERRPVPFSIPAGATDALAFLVRGIPAVTLGCVDLSIGAPRHYHRVSDTPDNLDPVQYEVSMAFVERLARRLWCNRPNAKE